MKAIQRHLAWLVLLAGAAILVAQEPLMRTPRPTPGPGGPGTTPVVTPARTPAPDITEIPSPRPPVPDEFKLAAASPRCLPR